MEAYEIGLLVAAGVASGGLNAIAGGGSLVTFPALIGVGLPPVAANVTNSVAVSPGYLAGVLGGRADLAGQGRLVRRSIPTAALGAVIGCVLLLATPARAFEVIVPFLVLAAAATLAFQDRLRGLVGHPRAMASGRQAVTVQVMVLIGSVYGGYFGAALGVMLLAALALVVDDSLNRINALKNVISATVGVVTVVVFAIFGPVNWAAALTLAPATIIGGYAGARLARRLPARVLKVLIVTLGTVIGVILMWRAFG